MDKKYEVLEYHKVINNLIDKSKFRDNKGKIFRFRDF